ncbi:MAG: type II secretion system F family protein [Candidatus Hydrogenedentes bacterium]|nr:type II secretion system F family protein [Candidatus Hydrogenedentota bacterium]
MAANQEKPTPKKGARRPAKKKVVVSSSIEQALAVDTEVRPAAPPVTPRVVPVVESYPSRQAPSGGSWLRSNTVRSVDITIFVRQLIMLLEAGTPILKSLKTLARRGQRPGVRALVADIAEYVEMGNPLWQAFDRHPKYFDTVFVNLIKASEASGTLVPVLRRVVEYREERELLHKRVRGALIYPVILLTGCLAVLLLLSYFVIPQFESMYERAGVEIPGYTQGFLAASHWFAAWWWALILGIVLLVVIYKLWWVRHPVRRLAADRWKLRIPVIGQVIHKHALVEMTRTLSLLLKSGLSMMATLDLTRKAIHNRAVAQSLQRMRDSVERGGGLEEPMRQSERVIPPVVTDMFVTGEESGRLDLIAQQIADTYEEDVKIAVNNMGELLQPIITVIIGGIVVFLFVVLFLPIISMIDQLNGSAM